MVSPSPVDAVRCQKQGHNLVCPVDIKQSPICLSPVQSMCQRYCHENHRWERTSLQVQCMLQGQGEISAWQAMGLVRSGQRRPDACPTVCGLCLHVPASTAWSRPGQEAGRPRTVSFVSACHHYASVAVVLSYAHTQRTLFCQ